MEIKILRRVLHAIDATPDALVDFHTEGDTQKAWTLPQQSVSTSQHFGEFVPSFEQTYAPSHK